MDERPRIVLRYEDGESASGIARAYGVTHNTILRILRQEGIEIIRRQARGARHGQWRGGRSLTTQGYVRIWADPDHLWYATMAMKSGHTRFFLEHRLAMAEYLGRPLATYEEVHHINGDKTDNRLENLQLRIGPHGSGQVWHCADCGSSNVIAGALCPVP